MQSLNAGVSWRMSAYVPQCLRYGVTKTARSVDSAAGMRNTKQPTYGVTTVDLRRQRFTVRWGLQIECGDDIYGLPR